MAHAYGAGAAVLTAAECRDLLALFEHIKSQPGVEGLGPRIRPIIDALQAAVRGTDSSLPSPEGIHAPRPEIMPGSAQHSANGELIDTATASRLLGLTGRRVRQLAGSGLLPASRDPITDQWRFQNSDVEAYRVTESA